jgi:flagellin
MGITLGTNTNSIFAANSVSSGYRSIERVMEKLSSGWKINHASDDPSGLVISELLRSRIASLNQEMTNISANIDKYNAVSSTVSELRSQLTQLREMAIGAANGAVNSQAMQNAYNVAAKSIVDTFNATVADAEYNGVKMLDGSESALANVDELTGIDLSSPQAAVKSMDIIDTASAALDTVQVRLGSTVRDDFQSNLASLSVTSENLTAAESGIRDTDYAATFVDYIVNSIRTRAAIAMLAHSNMLSSTLLQLFRS